MSTSQFLHIPGHALTTGAAALLVTGWMGATDIANAASANTQATQAQGWQFMPSRVCDASAPLQYTVSATRTYEKGQIAQDSSGVVLCPIAPEQARVISNIMGYADRNAALYYLVASNSSARKGPLPVKDAIKLLTTAHTIPSGLVFTDSGVPQPIGDVQVPPTDQVRAEQVSLILTSTSETNIASIDAPPLSSSPAATKASVISPSDWHVVTRNGIIEASLVRNGRAHNLNNYRVFPDGTVTTQATITHQGHRMTADLEINGNDVRISNRVGGTDELMQDRATRWLIDAARQDISDFMSPTGHGPQIAQVSARMVTASIETPPAPIEIPTLTVDHTDPLALAPAQQFASGSLGVNLNPDTATSPIANLNIQIASPVVQETVHTEAQTSAAVADHPPAEVVSPAAVVVDRPAVDATPAVVTEPPHVEAPAPVAVVTKPWPANAASYAGIGLLGLLAAGTAAVAGYRRRFASRFVEANLTNKESRPLLAIASADSIDKTVITPSAFQVHSSNTSRPFAVAQDDAQQETGIRAFFTVAALRRTHRNAARRAHNKSASGLGSLWRSKPIIISNKAPAAAAVNPALALPAATPVLAIASASTVNEPIFDHNTRTFVSSGDFRVHNASTSRPFADVQIQDDVQEQPATGISSSLFSRITAIGQRMAAATAAGFAAIRQPRSTPIIISDKVPVAAPADPVLAIATARPVLAIAAASTIAEPLFRHTDKTVFTPGDFSVHESSIRPGFAGIQYRTQKAIPARLAEGLDALETKVFSKRAHMLSAALVRAQHAMARNKKFWQRSKPIIIANDVYSAKPALPLLTDGNVAAVPPVSASIDQPRIDTRVNANFDNIPSLPVITADQPAEAANVTARSGLREIVTDTRTRLLSAFAAVRSLWPNSTSSASARMVNRIIPTVQGFPKQASTRTPLQLTAAADRFATTVVLTGPFSVHSSSLVRPVQQPVAHESTTGNPDIGRDQDGSQPLGTRLRVSALAANPDSQLAVGFANTGGMFRPGRVGLVDNGVVTPAAAEKPPFHGRFRDIDADGNVIDAGDVSVSRTPANNDAANLADPFEPASAVPSAEADPFENVPAHNTVAGIAVPGASDFEDVPPPVATPPAGLHLAIDNTQIDERFKAAKREVAKCRKQKKAGNEVSLDDVQHAFSDLKDAVMAKKLAWPEVRWLYNMQMKLFGERDMVLAKRTEEQIRDMPKETAIAATKFLARVKGKDMEAIEMRARARARLKQQSNAAPALSQA